MNLDDLARDAVAAAPTTTPDLGALRNRVKQRRRNRRIAASAVAAPVILLASFGAWSLVDRDSSSTQVVAAGSDAEPGTTPSAEATAPRGFVWPAPPRDFGDLEELTDGLIEEVLGWPRDRVRQDGGSDEVASQSFTLVNLDTNRELHVVAVPSAQGWGFVEIGDPGATIGEGAGGGFAIKFQIPPGTATSTVEVRYLDGTITSETTTQSEIPLPDDRAPQTVASVLTVHADANGTVITISSGQFNGADELPPAPTEEATISVPDLVGLDVDEATNRLNTAGLVPEVIETQSTGTPPGVVISVEPAPGVQIPVGTTVAVTVAAAPSQSEADADRDEVVPAVAALPFDVRVNQIDELSGPTRVNTDEGTWIISQPRVDLEPTNPCLLGDTDGVYGLDYVCVFEYGEILLLDHETGQIIRAYPFTGFKPQTLQATSDAVYCIRQGDGGLPDSMLCRIDLTTLDATIRVFPSALDYSGPPSDSWIPANWTYDEPTDMVLWSNLDATDTSVTISGGSGTATIDPDTLAILTVDASASG